MNTILIIEDDQRLASLLLVAIVFMTVVGYILATITIQTNNALTITFADQGIGMSPDDQNNLFRMFYRGTNHMQHGHGIGMVLVERILTLHKAKIEVTSKEGHGTRFMVTLSTK